MHWNPTKLAALTAALLLSACGGGGSETSTKVTFTSLVSFGDSLSDVGTYKVGTIAAVGGGKWTVNDNTSTASRNWTEFLAGQLNLSAPCAAETGILPNAAMVSAGIVSVAVTEHTSCTNYAQGSARVTSTFAPSSVALQSLSTAANLGLLAVPVKNQIANHLSRVTQFSGTELVTVLAGANDAFMHLNAVSAATVLLTTDDSTTRTAALGAAIAAGWSTTMQATIQSGTAAAVASAAPTEAVTGMATAAAELAGYITTSVVGKGAKYVVVVNVPNIVQTPRGQSLTASGQTLLGTMVTTYNSALKAALPSSVVLADAYTQGMDQYANPTQYGLTNVTTPTCSATGNILAGSSLVCNSSNLTSGVDVSTYQFADDVHPTPAGYKLLNRFVALKLAAAGWL
jgi:phospholipase/lecithinase/hemolysin